MIPRSYNLSQPIGGETEFNNQRTQAQTMLFNKVDLNDNMYPQRETNPIDMTRPNKYIIDPYEVMSRFGERSQNVPFQFD